MIKKAAQIFGVVFVIVGILGFAPGITTGGHLLGIFHVNTAHNMVHLLTGIIALAVGFRSEHASRVFFQVLGAVYGLVAILGFVYGDRPILGLISNNLADTLLHVVIACVSLCLGFMARPVQPTMKHV
jgi:hypothetical protein